MTQNPGIDCWTAWSGPAATLLIIPVEDGQVYGYAAGSRGGGPADDPGRLAGAFAQFPPMVVATTSQLMDHPVDLYHSPVSDVRSDHWSNGAVVLVGDATHATGPVGAQGAAMPLEGALVLAELLCRRVRLVARGSGVRSQAPSTRRACPRTDKMSRLVGLPSPIRNLLGPLLGPRGYRDATAPCVRRPDRAAE